MANRWPSGTQMSIRIPPFTALMKSKYGTCDKGRAGTCFVVRGERGRDGISFYCATSVYSGLGSFTPPPLEKESSILS